MDRSFVGSIQGQETNDTHTEQEREMQGFGVPSISRETRLVVVVGVFSFRTVRFVLSKLWYCARTLFVEPQRRQQELSPQTVMAVAVVGLGVGWVDVCECVDVCGCV